MDKPIKLESVKPGDLISFIYEVRKPAARKFVTELNDQYIYAYDKDNGDKENVTKYDKSLISNIELNYRDFNNYDNHLDIAKVLKKVSKARNKLRKAMNQLVELLNDIGDRESNIYNK